MRILKFLCLTIISLSDLKAQEIDLKGFKLGDTWDNCMNIIHRNYPKSFRIEPEYNWMYFDEGILSPLTRTSVDFENNKVCKVSSGRSFAMRTFYSARDKNGNERSYRKSVEDIQQEYQQQTNSANQTFTRCYSFLESKYGAPIQTSEQPEAVWNINNTIIRLYATSESEKNGYSWSIVVTYEIGRIEPDKNKPSTTNSYTASGSGIIITANGIIATNHHVIKGASVIDVQMTRNGKVKTYKSIVLVDDKTNDLALLKIEDASFKNFLSIPYALKASICDVGTSVFAMGYPMSNYLGDEVKITDGLISSKTGYQGDIVTYQISVPIQHGNSGGPLFDKQGNLVGITNAGVPQADNVGYAIKASYLRNLIDVSPIPINIPSDNKISNLSFTEKIKVLSDYIVHIKVK